MLNKWGNIIHSPELNEKLLLAGWLHQKFFISGLCGKMTLIKVTL